MGRAPDPSRTCRRPARSSLALLGAIALYALATVVRGERWQRLLEDEGGAPARVDTYALTCVGYMGNNLLPARAGDAIRAVLMAPRAGTSIRTVIGTLLAERLLDVAVLVVLFVVVGYGLLGEVGGDSVEIILLVAAGLAVAGVLAYFAVRRNEKLRRLHRPDAVRHARAAARAPRAPAARHDAGDLGVSRPACGWPPRAASASAWTRSRASTSSRWRRVFSMIPSGPAYAGTQDAAAILGIKALGGTGAQAVAYIVMLRFIIVVPITLVGLVLLAARYGGLGRLREARAVSGDARWPQDAPAAAAAARARRPRGELIAYAVLVARRARAAASTTSATARSTTTRARTPTSRGSFCKNGDYEYDPLLHGPLRFYLTAAMYTLFGDSDFTARLAPGADGDADGRPSPTCCATSSAAWRRSRPAVAPRLRPVATCTSRASPARTSTSRRSRWRCSSSPSASSTRRGATTRR